MTALLWFRNDLRISDNPALNAAARSGEPVLPIYILDSAQARPLGAASQWWLHHSLKALQDDLTGLGLSLQIFKGNAAVLLPHLAKQARAEHIFWNRRYDADGVTLDKDLKAGFKEAGLNVESFKANLLFEPWEITTGEGNYYKVFTPFWRACLRQDQIAPALNAPKTVAAFEGELDNVGDLASLDLRPTSPNWADGFDAYFTPGTKSAFDKLKRFLSQSVTTYKDDRNRPDLFATSRLSPHLAFGEISPRQIWQITKAKTDKGDKFLSEIGWREFSYALLFYNPNLASESFKPAFDKFSWDNNAAFLRAWQRGQTGYPFVDAGMRELWATGWQHNRVRMVTASFLIKHLRTDWREGERWFWDCLVDADPANNAASWQWVAGSGADAAPYFRIFNPFTQGQKFDPQGEYVRIWVPELARLPEKFIHTPWEAPERVLLEAGVKLGENYPKPIVEHKAAREAALSAYQATKA